jgi:hypothetical protein
MGQKMALLTGGMTAVFTGEQVRQSAFGAFKIYLNAVVAKNLSFS